MVSEETGEGLYGEIGAVNLGIENMAETCVQGRGVMIDLRAHCGDERRAVGFDELMAILNKDDVEVMEGDLVCLHTGFADRIVAAAETPEPVGAVCTALDGDDKNSSSGFPKAASPLSYPTMSRSSNPLPSPAR